MHLYTWTVTVSSGNGFGSIGDMIPKKEKEKKERKKKKKRNC